MGCNCGGGGNQTPRAYIYTPPSGSSTTYSTEIEAKAAVVRGGGSYKPTG